MTLTNSNKPTLFKAVEAAREALELSAIDLWIAHLPDNVEVKEAIQVKNSIEKALAALPNKPKSEEEICLLMLPWLTGNGAGVDIRMAAAANILQALKAHGCLYVKED